MEFITDALLQIDTTGDVDRFQFETPEGFRYWSTVAPSGPQTVAEWLEAQPQTHGATIGEILLSRVC